jgi:hypothetical protein
LPKILIDSDPKKTIANTRSRVQGRESANSACVLDYNFENSSKNRLLTSNPPLRQKGLVSANQSNNNSRVLQVNTKPVTTLTQSQHPSSTKNVVKRRKGHSRGKSLTEESLSGIRNIHSQAMKIKRIVGIGSNQESKRPSFSSQAGGVDNLRTATRIIGDNNHRLTFKREDKGDSNLKFKDSSKNLNVYSTMLNGDPAGKVLENNKNHVYVDLKKSYALAENTNTNSNANTIPNANANANVSSVRQSRADNKLFSSSFVLVKDENVNKSFVGNIED